MRKALIFVILIAIFLTGNVFSEEIKTTDIIENKNSRIILLPTAYTKQKGQYETSIGMEPFRIRSSIGISNRLMLGVSYGGEHVVGTQEIDWYPRVEFLIKYRLFDEKYSTPAFSFGFSSIGWGKYLDSYDRYAIKSRGFYGVVSKRLEFLGGTYLNFGVNYSVEGRDEEQENGFNMFTSMRKNLNEELAVIGEYDFAINDNGENRLGEGKGYLNLGIRWTFAPELIIDFQFTNLLHNFNTDNKQTPHIADEKNKVARNITVTYKAYF